MEAISLPHEVTNEELRLKACRLLRLGIQALFALYTVALSCSMAAMEILSWSLALLLILYVIVDREKTVQFHRLGVEIPLLIFFVTVIVGLKINAPESAVLHGIGRLRNLVLLYVLTYCFQLFGDVKKLFLLLLSCAGLIAIYGIWQHFTGIDLWRHDHRAVVAIPWITTETLYTTVGFFNHHLTYAHSFAMILCGAWSMLLLRRNNSKWPNILVGIAAILITVSLVFSYSRGIWIALLFSLPTMAFFVNRKMACLTFAILLGIGTLFYLENPVFQKRAHSIIQGNYQSNEEREKLWAANLEMFKEHPFVGVGYEQNEPKTMEYYQKMGIVGGMAGHAHNNYIEFLATTGLIGFICYLFFIGILFRKTILCFLKLPKIQVWARVLILSSLGAQLTFHLGGLTQFNFGDSKVQHQFLFWLALMSFIQFRFSNTSGSANKFFPMIAPRIFDRIETQRRKTSQELI